MAAGGGFKQTLVTTGIGGLVADWVKDSGMSVLFLAWLVAVLIRLATGSATVTAAGILSPLVGTLDSGETSLLVLAIGPARCSSPTSTTRASGWSRSISG